jgi:CubicO group peptidase (beta-lactamase class C family)
MRIVLIALLLLVGVQDPLWSQSDGDLARRLDAFVNTYAEMEVFSGAVLVAVGDDVVLEKGYGMASYPLEVPATPEHRFRVASVSKAFTDAAVLRLVASGTLEWDDLVSDYVPEFPRGDEITIRMLATNQSGVPHINNLPWYDQFGFQDWPLERIIEHLKTEPLDFDPGTDSSYSNGGFALLALVIERATDKSYGGVLRDQVFVPAGMLHSGHEGHNELVPGLAQGYTYGIDGLEPAPYVEMSIKIGGGSAYSTVGDLYRFAHSIRDGTLIDPALADSLFGTIDSPTGHRRVYHGGRAPGYTAALVRYPDEDVVVVVLSNNYARLNEEISDGLAGIVFGGTYDNRLADILSRQRFRGVDVEEARIASYAGAWRHAWGFEFELEDVDGALVYRDPERGLGHRLIPLSETTFISPWQWARIDFAPGPDGAPESATMTWLDFPEKAWPLETLNAEPVP